MSEREIKTGLTQERLKELLSYDPETGIFTRVKNVKGALKGAIAGTTHEHGYIIICVDGNDFRAHRLAFFYMDGEWPPERVDHKDRVRDNNIWTNLRKSSNSENNTNSSIQSNNTSGQVGVTWDKSRSKWAAEIRSKVHGRKRLGRFTEFEDAVKARKAAEKEYGFSEDHGKEAPKKYKNR